MDDTFELGDFDGDGRDDIFMFDEQSQTIQFAQIQESADGVLTLQLPKKSTAAARKVTVQ